MKRLVLVVLALAAFAPATASASVPCRDRIYNDWYPDGKIGTNYPISCYRDALKHIRSDALTYSNLADDIRSAMQAAIERRNHRNVPAQVGKSGPATPISSRGHTTKPSGDVKSTDSSSSGQEPVSQTVPQTSTVSVGDTGGGSGVPVPLLVLGGLALLLIAVGGVGAVAKRRRT